MALELQGANVQALVRDYGSTDEFQEMVCEDTLILDITNDVSKTDTKCGPFKGVKTADVKANGSGVSNFDPTQFEYSYDELQSDQIAIQKKQMVIQNKAYDTYGAGEIFRFDFGGYFVSSQGNFSNGEPTKFTWNFEGVGTPNITES